MAILRDGGYRRLDRRDVPLLAPGRAHRHRLSLRRADRSLRQPEHDGDRRLSPSQSTRLPGAGGAPEIAGSARQVLILLKQSKRAFVERLDFITSVGYWRWRRRARTAGPDRRWPDRDHHRPAACWSLRPGRNEFIVTQLHPGVTREQVEATIGWRVRFADPLGQTDPPTEDELRCCAICSGGRRWHTALVRVRPSTDRHCASMRRFRVGCLHWRHVP